jgi:hypothetical protein
LKYSKNESNLIVLEFCEIIANPVISPAGKSVVIKIADYPGVSIYRGEKFVTKI